MSNTKNDNFFWPDVSSLESAKKAVGYGVEAAGLVAVFCNLGFHASKHRS